MTMKKITAGRDMLGEFAPKFAQLNDDVLFGEVWSRESELSARDRSLITVTALMAQGLTDTSFGHHLAMAKENGITRSEIAEILTHAAFYAGWPKAWAAFRMAKDIWADAENTDEKQLHQNSMVFPIGAPNDGFAQYFSGQSYLAPVSTEQVKIFNVTFEPGCRNNWHIHEADKGGGQILICVAGRGYYQEWGKEPQELHPGDVINIMPGVKHWHGAAPDSWFSHLAVEVPGENCRSQWCEPVSEEEYQKLKYTQFRIGRWENGESVVNEGSQFPNDAASVDQFFRQMTPDTGMTSDMGGDFDNETVAKAVAATIDEVYERTGKNSILVTHSQGGGPGWTAARYTDHIAAIVAIEPGGAPGADSEDFKAVLEKNIPVTMYFGDYIDNGDPAIQATMMWQAIRQACYDFRDAYNEQGGNCTVVDLPQEGITGNDHFMFQDLNNDVIADHIENWIQENVK